MKKMKNLKLFEAYKTSTSKQIYVLRDLRGVAGVDEEAIAASTNYELIIEKFLDTFFEMFKGKNSYYKEYFSAMTDDTLDDVNSLEEFFGIDKDSEAINNYLDFPNFVIDVFDDISGKPNKENDLSEYEILKMIYNDKKDLLYLEMEWDENGDEWTSSKDEMVWGRD